MHTAITVTQTKGQGGRATFDADPYRLHIGAAGADVAVADPDYGALIDALSDSGDREIKGLLIYRGLRTMADAIRDACDDAGALALADTLDRFARIGDHGEYDDEKAILAALAAQG